MHIHKNYFHDKSILSLLATNGSFAILIFIYVFLKVSNLQEQTSVSITSYRSNLSIQTSGPTNTLYEFAIFALVVTAFTIALSVKLYSHRKHLAIGLLGLNLVSLVMCFFVFRALTGEA